MADVRPWVIPLGFSYLSFELLHVIIERRRGRITAWLFPTSWHTPCSCRAESLGPIRRFPDFTAAVKNAHASPENLYAGVLRILIGLGKKLVIADTLALTGAELAYATGQAHAWTIVLAYTFRIYFDFSAYSDLAIGFSRLLGIAIPENFSYRTWPPISGSSGTGGISPSRSGCETIYSCRRAGRCSGPPYAHGRG